MEFYVENPTVQFDVGQEFDEDREHLPRYFNPTEAYEGSPTWDKYKLILLSERPRFGWRRWAPAPAARTNGRPAARCRRTSPYR